MNDVEPTASDEAPEPGARQETPGHEPAPAEQETLGPHGLAAVFGPTINAVFAPSKAFDALAARPGLAAWILVWITAGMIALAMMNLDVQRQFMRVGMVQGMRQGSQQMDAEQLARAVDRLDSFAPFFVVGQNVFLLIMVLVIAVVLWGGSTMLGGRTRFSRSLSVASVAAVAHPLLVTAYVSFNWWLNPPEVRRIQDIADAVPTLSLDLLFGSGEMSMTMRTFLMRIDLFNIWWVLIVVIGSERLLGLKRGAAVGLALAIWIVSAALSALMTGLST